MPLYLDHNATTPLDPRVFNGMLPWLRDGFGNPSSVHRFGRLARGALDRAREQVAALVGAQPGQVIFTSGGTEANNLALHGTARSTGRGVAVSAIEHPSVLGPARQRSPSGGRLVTIPADRSGCVTPEALRAVLDRGIGLVSVMSANNETGVVQPIAALAEVARAHGALLHTDAVQAAGKMPVDFNGCGADLMSLSAHKFHGPKGVGALVVDRRVELDPLIGGGGQELGRRGGTENLAGIVGFGLAAELAAAEWRERAEHLLSLRTRFETGLAEVPGVQLFGADAARLPNTTFLALPGIDGETLLMELDRIGIAVSSGSACSSGSTEPSHVLTAMGVPAATARCAIRVSFGRDNSADDIDTLLAGLRGVQQRIQATAAVAW